MITEAYLNNARKIPPSVRDKYILIEADPISNAIASNTDPYMKTLANIWQRFIMPTEQVDFNCQRCLNGVLNNFRELKDSLLELQRRDILFQNL